ncbi:hypothetical protein [Parasitella parasitica]|uniref:DUF8032 domain-containing protein n=1 Tax=Parasitella parasitica TaxID=35722 RepID=A0A0B7NE70_9FUNG|nr:hypothetical protein [Parasitella parasitica]
MNTSAVHVNTLSGQTLDSTYSDYHNNSIYPTWSSTTMAATTSSTAAPRFSRSRQINFMDVLDSNELDMSLWPSTTIIDQPVYEQSIASPLDNLFAPWNNINNQVPPTIKEELTFFNNNNVLNEEPLSYLSMPMPQSQKAPSIVSPTSPATQIGSSTGLFSMTKEPINVNSLFASNFQQQVFQEITPPSSASTSGSNSPSSNVSTPPPMLYFLPQQHQMLSSQYDHGNNATATTRTRGCGRRKSADGHSTPTRTYRRRASSHPSVASVVSLTAHEPVARIINGVEHITFLYSHDRLVKEYTVRTNINTVNLDEIPAGFRVQNAIYPRANVLREEYDGNRWEYETSCNKLGWKLCWLNQEQLCGRRGLIQRAVDSYRNRHAEMRSRRVTRQEKVANGTLRKRRAKKAASALL